MNKYITKPVTVEAEQFDYNCSNPLVKITFPQIIYSLGGKLFYISHCGMAKNWLSVEKIEKDGDAKYESYSFMMYSFKSGKTEPATKDHHLVKLYVEMFKEEGVKMPNPYAWVDKTDSKKEEVKKGDWLVSEDNWKTCSIVPDSYFKLNYELHNE